MNPIDHTDQLQCPLLGLFGDDDQNPDPQQVDEMEAALQRFGRDYEFHRYPGAGHGFFYDHWPQYHRVEQAVDGWEKVWSFLDRYLRQNA